MPRKCTICSHKQTSKINKAISDGASLRRIAAQYSLSPNSILRHTENCLKLSLSAFVEKKLEKQGIDVYKEFEANLEFARKLRAAAEEYLADPLDPLRLAIIPRADEIDVVYYESWAAVSPAAEGESDGTEVAKPTRLPKPTKKTAKLSMLLESVEEMRNIEVDKVSIRHMDLRKFALDAIEVADTCVDRFAKLRGEYQQDKPNAENIELARLKGKIEARAAEKKTSYDEELRNYLEHYSADVRPEWRDRLASELEM